MRFRSHLLASAAAALALYPRRPLSAAAVVAAGTLIDLDHLLLYALQTGDWSVSGALHYDRYRHSTPAPGDSRPRYGPLRSLLHEPWLLLPLVWSVAAGRPALRPAAIGLSLHLLLDYLHWPRAFLVQRRARGICALCGRHDPRRLRVQMRLDADKPRFVAVCRRCRVNGL